MNNRWMEPIDRFYNQHSINPQTHCWEWIGGTAGRGYGQFQVAGKKVLAHRFSWEHHNGPIPSGKFVCHKCDNVLCVNPDHLFVGTHSDNMQDMANKGRHWSAKLFKSDRTVIGRSAAPTKYLADLYGVHRTTIQRIRRKARAALKVIK